MNKEKLLKSLPWLGTLAVVLVLGSIAFVRAESILSSLSPKVYVAGNYIEAAGSNNQVVAGGFLGASGGTQTSPTSVSNSTNWDTGYFWGDFEVKQSAYFDGATSFVGTTTLGNTILGGTAEAQTAVATGTLAVSSVCNDSFLSITPASLTPTITFPATTTLFATCLGTVGQYRDIVFKAITTSTIFAAGAGGSILNTSALTIAAGKGAVLRFIHDTAASGGTYIVALINLVN